MCIEVMKCEAPFTNSTGSMTGDTAFDDKGMTYIVKSYGVPIAEVRHDEVKDKDGKVIGYTRSVWITERKYSVTTSKHTTYARRALVI
jgi:hypothetical protein